MMFVKGGKKNLSRPMQADSYIGDEPHGRVTTSSPEFKNAVLKYADGLKQSAAMEKAAREFGIQLPLATCSTQDRTLTDGGAKVSQNDDLWRKGKGKFPNNIIHLISYSLRLSLPDDCERYIDRSE